MECHYSLEINLLGILSCIVTILQKLGSAKIEAEKRRDRLQRNVGVQVLRAWKREVWVNLVKADGTSELMIAPRYGILLTILSRAICSRICSP